jgi:hypothetical protein
VLFLARAESVTAVLDLQLFTFSKATQTVIDFKQVLVDDRHMTFHQSGAAQEMEDTELDDYQMRAAPNLDWRFSMRS